MRLTANVIVRRPSDSTLVVLAAGEEVPDWAADMVTNPSVLTDLPPAEAPEVTEEVKESDAGDDDDSDTDDTGDTPAEVVTEEASAEEIEASEESDDDSATEETEATAETEAPSNEWTLRQLREYAQANDIDLGEARVKADILEVLNQ